MSGRLEARARSCAEPHRNGEQHPLREHEREQNRRQQEEGRVQLRLRLWLHLLPAGQLLRWRVRRQAPNSSPRLSVLQVAASGACLHGAEAASEGDSRARAGAASACSAPVHAAQVEEAALAEESSVQHMLHLLSQHQQATSSTSSAASWAG